ncbi:MAG: hypothetical protein MUF54_16300 [Polyangiaceae bacterium]|jgi:hypothetical protein|nr:hypothetical protein [Polyangiaceae bacterium]
MTRWIWASLWMAPLALGCTTLTHANDFEVSQPPPDRRVCALCPSRPDLAHPPCPPPSPQNPAEGVYFFAVRRMEIGFEPNSWTAQDYRTGLDQDCSDRSNGKPSLCLPRNPDMRFETVNRGIDNALAIQVLSKVPVMTQFDVTSLFNDEIEHGAGMGMLIVDGWNGEQNDDHIRARSVLGKRVMNSDSVPKWDGQDVWEVYADRWDPDFSAGTVPDTANKTDTAYVRDGVLVWDARALNALSVPVVAMGGVTEVRLANPVLAVDVNATARPRELNNGVVAGVWPLSEATRNAKRLAQLITACDASAADNYANQLDALFNDAADMPSTASERVAPCDGISVGILLHYVEFASVGGIVPLSSIPESCAGSGSGGSVSP